MAQLVKNLPAMRETWVWSLGWEDPLEKGKATHSSILAWRVQSMGSQRVRYDWATFTSLHFRPLYPRMCSSVYQLPSRGFSTSVKFFIFLSAITISSVQILTFRKIFLFFMPYWNLQCISDKAVKCDNKNLFNHEKKKKKPVSYRKHLLCFFGLFYLFLILCFTLNSIYQYGSECL